MAVKIEAYVADELMAQARRQAEAQGVSLAQLVRSALKLAVQLEVERAIGHARTGSGIRTCVVCAMPRRADAVQDAMAHAQCDQIVSKLDRQVETR